MKASMLKKNQIIFVILTLFLVSCALIYTIPVCGQGIEKTETVKAEQAVSAGSGGTAGYEKNAEIESREKKSVFLYEWFKRGGIFMWPILISAALAMGLIIERFLFYKKAKLKPAGFLEEVNERLDSGNIDDVITLCKEKEMVISRVLLKGLNLRKLGLDHVEKGISAAGSIEVASLEKGLSVLSAIGNIAPLIGFLGTVSGMITAFQSIAAADQVSARLVAGGIYEALITTEAGLIVAIPVLAFYNFFVHRIETFVADIERISSDIAEKMLGENG